jgi:hypothetical protein
VAIQTAHRRQQQALEIGRAQPLRETRVRETRDDLVHRKTQPVLALRKTVRELRTIAMCHSQTRSREIARVRQRGRMKLRAPAPRTTAVFRSRAIAPALQKPRRGLANRRTIATFHSQEIPETTVRAK